MTSLDDAEGEPSWRRRDTPLGRASSSVSSCRHYFLRMVTLLTSWTKSSRSRRAAWAGSPCRRRLLVDLLQRPDALGLLDLALDDGRRDGATLVAVAVAAMPWKKEKVSSPWSGWGRSCDRRRKAVDAGRASRGSGGDDTIEVVGERVL